MNWREIRYRWRFQQSARLVKAVASLVWVVSTLLMVLFCLGASVWCLHKGDMPQATYALLAALFGYITVPPRKE